jgi:hypothetical protein
MVQHAGPGERDMDPRIAVPVARLQEQHASVFILAQAIGQGAAGRTGADDDVGVFLVPNDCLLPQVIGLQRAGAITSGKRYHISESAASMRRD